MRSAPTSRGLSYLIAIPVLVPGPTMRGFTLKYRKHTRSKVGIIGGTTEEMMISLISFTSTFRSWKNKFIINMPYSSVVRTRSVEIRQCPTSSVLSYTPRTILVFPTSITNNMNASYLRGRIDTSPAITRLTVPSGILTNKLPSSSISVATPS